MTTFLMPLAQSRSGGFPILPFMVLPILVTALVGGGWGATLLSTALAVLSFHAVAREHPQDMDWRIAELLLAGQGLLVAILGEMIRRGRHQLQLAEAKREELEGRLHNADQERLALAEGKQCLQESLDKVEDTYETAPVGLCVLDAELRYVRINARLAAMNGIPVASHIGRRLRDVVPALADALEPPLQQAIDSGEALLETEVMMPNVTEGAQERCWLANCVPLKSPEGRVVAINVAIKDITAQKRAELALRDSEEKHRLLTEASPQLVWLNSADGGITYANCHWLEYSGLSLEHLQGSGWTETVHPEDRERILAAFGEALRNGEPYEGELRLRNNAGAYRWHLARALPLKEGQERATQWLGIGMDIHERRCAEEILRAREMQLRLALEGGRMAIWQYDGAKDRLWFQDCGGNVLGSLAEGRESSVESWLGALDEDDHQLFVFRETLARKLATNEPFTQEFRILDDSGNIRWLEARGLPIGDDAFQANSVMGIVIDISQRKAVEEQLRHSEQLYRAIGESINYGIWTCLPDGRNTYFSDSFLQLVGRTQEQCAGFGWHRLLSPEERQAVLADWQACIEQGAVWDREMNIRGADGRWHPILSRGVPVRNSNGTVVYWAGMHLDIRRLKEAEEELRDVDRRKDQFLAVLSHELRNPLTPILTAAQILRRQGAEKPELVQWASDSIERQVKLLTRLTDDLLDVSRVARGKLQLQQEPIDLNSVIALALETCRPRIDQNRQVLEVTSSAAPLWIHGDMSRLVQVLDNLLLNAVKFSPPGGRITLRMYEDEDEAVVSVKDTGIGLEAEALGKIFQPFFQVEEATARNHGGLGIGLALARSLVSMHGGTLDAESDGLGRGSQFTMRLPLLGSVPRTLPAEERVTRAGTPLGKRILVVDDNPNITQSLRLLLEAGGNQVMTASTGYSALELAVETLPDCVVLDIGLPDLDGYAVAQEMRKIAALKDVQIIAMTGYGRAHPSDHGIPAEFDQYLLKPVDSELLLASIAAASPVFRPFGRRIGNAPAGDIGVTSQVIAERQTEQEQQPEEAGTGGQP